MKKILILLTFIAATNVYGQQAANSISAAEFKKVQVGINFSTDYNFRTLKNIVNEPIVVYILEQRNFRETFKVSYTTGLNICFNLTKNVGIETGAQYSKKGYENRNALFFEEDLLSSNPTPSNGKLAYNFHYLDLPLAANFSFGNRKVRFISSAGLTTNILMKQTTKFISETENNVSQTSSQSFNKVNFSPTISFGIDYKINDALNLRVSPTFRYGISKIIDAAITAYLWNAGINVGLYL